jgi:hypothetical protein
LQDDCERDDLGGDAECRPHGLLLKPAVGPGGGPL